MTGRSVEVDVADLPPGGMRALDAEGTPILLCNVEGRFYAIENRCPHVRIPLDGGRLRGAVLECPLHGGRLDVTSGADVAPPIRGPVRTYPVHDRGGSVRIDLD